MELPATEFDIAYINQPISIWRSEEGNFSFVAHIVESKGGEWVDKKPADEFKYTGGGDNPGGLVTGWLPPDNAVKQDLDGDGKTEVNAIYWKALKQGEKDHETPGKWDIYEYESGVYVAFNTQYNVLEPEKVQYDLV